MKSGQAELEKKSYHIHWAFAVLHGPVLRIDDSSITPFNNNDRGYREPEP
jgi:hypothetical protein